MADSNVQQLMEQLTDNNVVPDYHDGEIILVDSVKNLFTNDHPDHIWTKTNVILTCKSGKMHMTVNGGETIEIHKDQVFICPPEVILENIMVSADFEFTGLCITSNALMLCLGPHINEWNHVVYIKKQHIITLFEEETILYSKANDLLNCALKRPLGEERKRNEVIRRFVAAGVLGLCFMLSEKIEQNETIHKQNISLFNRFLQILQSSDKKHLPVHYYASKLCITDKYLTEVCKKNSGKTANDWIREYTLADISYYLKNTQLSIKEICAKVGFDNNSFFGKYVKSAFGCTPMEYRNNKHKKE